MSVFFFLGGASGSSPGGGPVGKSKGESPLSAKDGSPKLSGANVTYAAPAIALKAVATLPTMSPKAQTSPAAIGTHDRSKSPKSPETSGGFARHRERGRPLSRASSQGSKESKESVPREPESSNPEADSQFNIPVRDFVNFELNRLKTGLKCEAVRMRIRECPPQNEAFERLHLYNEMVAAEEAEHARIMSEINAMRSEYSPSDN